jgi:signal transduction histidine kinase
MTARDGRELWIRDEAVVVEESDAPVLQGVLADITIRSSPRTRSWTRRSPKTEFLAGVSHELRNPLVGIIGWIQLLRDRPEMRIAAARSTSSSAAHSSSTT